MPIKRVKLNYISAVSKKSPIRKITVSSNHIEKLNRCVKQKLMQNEAEYMAGIEKLKTNSI